MTQEQALTILKTGANIFLTGEPGSGKTHTVNQYIAYLRAHDIEPSITASTGIAATHVGGMTIHSWSGVGIKRSLSSYDLDALMERESLVKRVNAAKVLIIDEISMLDATVLDMVEQIVRTIRGNGAPFGGLQMVFVGDFFQLPPIPEPGSAVQFAFEGRAWRTANPIVCYLSEQHRQEDQVYLNTLSAIRRGEIDDSVYEHLETRRVSPDAEEKEVTKLYTHNADVDRMNADALGRIKADTKTYTMDSMGNAKLVEGLKKNCMSPEVLSLKIGATVMFTKNNFEAGFVNGTLGVVVDFDHATSRPVVKTNMGKMITAEVMEWAIEDSGKILAKVMQVPLRLAWAITVHKSQGMSLDAAHMDLGRAFEYGQGYVALSRVRTIEGLYLQGLNARALEVHPRVLEIDEVFRGNSEAAEEEFSKMDETELQKLQNDCVLGMGGKLETKKVEKAKEVEMTPGKKKLLETREKYPNAGRPWSKEDSDDMVERFESGETEEDLGDRYGRKPSAIHARLVQLGIVEDPEWTAREEARKKAKESSKKEKEHSF